MIESKGLSVKQQELFDELTILQKKTAIGVLGGLSNVKAYRQAGGKSKTVESAYASVSEILRNPKVKAFMESVMQDQVNATIMERDEALKRLTRVGRFTVEEKDLDEVASRDESDILKVKLSSSAESIKQIRAMQGWDLARKHEAKETEAEKPELDSMELARSVLFILHQANADKESNDQMAEKQILKLA
jgi:phage terminase small subunit